MKDFFSSSLFLFFFHRNYTRWHCALVFSLHFFVCVCPCKNWAFILFVLKPFREIRSLTHFQHDMLYSDGDHVTVITAKHHKKKAFSYFLKTWFSLIYGTIQNVSTRPLSRGETINHGMLSLHCLWIWCDVMRPIHPGLKLTAQKSCEILHIFPRYFRFTVSFSVVHTRWKLRLIIFWHWRPTRTRVFFSSPSAKTVRVNVNRVKVYYARFRAEPWA